MATSIKIGTFDGTVLKADLKLVLCLPALKVILNDWKMCNGQTLVLPRIRGDILKVLLVWVKHHQEQFGKGVTCDEWDYNFLAKNEEFLVELNKAADFLDVSELTELTGHAISKINET